MKQRRLIQHRAGQYTPPTPVTPRIPFTAAAYQAFQDEHTALETELQAVMVRLQTAREMGDLSENGAYTAAKFELGRIRRRLRYLKQMLAEGYVAEDSQKHDCVGFGSTVTLSDGTAELQFMMVSAHESDITAQKLSLESPIGKAIAGTRVGSIVTVPTPRGDVQYTVVRIE